LRTRRHARTVFAGAVLALTLPLAAQAQAPESDVKKDLEALRKMMDVMQRDILEIKGMLSRQAQGPPPSGIGTVIDYGNSPVKGDRTAKITLVEVSDYQCPFCARYVRDTYPQVDAEYVKTGKIRTVFLDLPLESIHKSAFKAAQAASCAGEQGKYWEMHDRLFQNQQALEPFTPHAAAIGLDAAKFDLCLASGKFDEDIRRDMAEARKVGVTGTPAFLIGRTDPSGTKLKVLAVVKGAKPYAEFKAELDRMLAEAAGPQAVAPAAAEPAAPAAAFDDTRAEPAPAAPALTGLAPDGTLDATTRATLDRILAAAPAGSPAWIAAPASDARAVALASDLAASFGRAGWRVRPLRRTQLRLRPGVHLFAGEAEAPAYVDTVQAALTEAGFSPEYRTGYRSFYDDRKKSDPQFQGFQFAPEQTFLLVVGRIQ